MERNRCLVCGGRIYKSALYDPYVCRDCEYENERMSLRYLYLDS